MKHFSNETKIIRKMEYLAKNLKLCNTKKVFVQLFYRRNQQKSNTLIKHL